MQIVPLQAVPNQTLNIQLDGQPCVINVYTDGVAIYVDLYVNAVLIIGGVLGRQAVRIVQDAYFGFQGDLLFIDTTPSLTFGPADPIYPGLGTQFLLLYLFPDELTTTFGVGVKAPPYTPTSPPPPPPPPASPELDFSIAGNIMYIVLGAV